jgi:hypothetical protein
LGRWFFEELKKMKFKKDKYKKNRGGYSRMLDITCRKCNNLVLTYQKDGPGNLRRLYMDRILGPNKYVGLEKREFKEIKNLECGKCSEVLGVFYIYKKENRKSFRLFQDAVVKKIRKLESG